jgi:membrane-bound lytic murein transglycosylase D
MEKHISMKLLKILCLASLIGLTACTTTASLSPSSDNSQPANVEFGDASPRVAPASHKPQFPSGELQPITTQQTASNGVAQLSSPVDLWERIRRGFAMPNLESDLVTDREQWYTTRPDYMLRMTERSRKYLFHIVEELEMRNMPTELALLPFIESAFNPQAISPVKATGMWQFMPATGKDYDLKQNAFRDDRRDVLASTRAALDYLQRLHGLFNDWHLALAAYNWGQGSVGRAVEKNRRAGLGTSYTELNMPMETRFYVPKLQAVKNIVNNPSNFRSQLPLIENHPFFQTVDIERDIDVALAAKLAEVSLEDFKALNPAVNRPVILAAGMPQILLPWDNAAVYQRNLEAYGGSRLASWTVWVAPTNMAVSDAAKRAGMTESDLRSLNNIPPRMLIRAGSSLLVTRSAQHQNDVAEHVADNGQLSFSPDVVLKRTLHKAGRNESVSTVAARYRVSKESIADWNRVSALAAFKVGQQVVLFLPVQTRDVRSKGTPNRTNAKTQPRKVKSPPGKPARDNPKKR